MEFVRQDISESPTPAQVVQAINKAGALYSAKIDALTKLYNNYVEDETAYNLYKRGLDVERIEKVRFPIARYITTILCNYMLGKQQIGRASCRERV